MESHGSLFSTVGNASTSLESGCDLFFTAFMRSQRPRCCNHDTLLMHLWGARMPRQATMAVQVHACIPCRPFSKHVQGYAACM